MTFIEEVEWTRNHLAGLRIGGVWVIPRSGLVIQRTQENEVTLIEAVPVESMPFPDGKVTKELWEDYQLVDFQCIEVRMLRAGYTVKSNVERIPASK